MSGTHEVNAVYPFRAGTLDQVNLAMGMNAMLGSFEAWRDGNPGIIAGHVDEFTNVLDRVAAEQGLPQRIGRLVLPAWRRQHDLEDEGLWVRYFGLHNLGEALTDDAVGYLQGRLHDARKLVDARRTHRAASRDMLGTVFRSAEQLAPELRGLPEMDWMEARVKRLQCILPENVIRSGGMSKVMRTIMGVLAIGVYDVRDAPVDERKKHLRKVIPGAYILGSTYALVDDTVQSNAGRAISASDKEKIHEQLAHGLATGEPVDTIKWPEHPLAEELSFVYNLLRERFPFSDYRHLYHSIEAMYLAQRRESLLTPETIASNGGVRSLYPDMAIKAAMTRVVANILGRREVPAAVYERLLNTVFISQLKDDFQDRFTDVGEDNLTPFSLPYDPVRDRTNPLYDLFAFAAYRSHVVWGGESSAMQALLRYDPSEFGPYIARNPDQARDTLGKYPHTAEIARFFMRAMALTRLQAQRVMPRDMQLEAAIGRRTQTRDQLGVDPRTFVSDRMDFLNETALAAVQRSGLLEEVATYSLSAGGKRLRPALTLMLAEALGVQQDKIKRLIQTVELIHTASLILDDLPAQDDASLRRGRPTAHIAFGEWPAQLASVAMISKGFGVLPDLRQHFPAARVTEVVRYADQMLGFGGLCEGQSMDLGMNTWQGIIGKADIEKMYILKTSLAISAALVPLMILTGRPDAEIKLIEKFAYDAGVVFQLRDDILDVTASAAELGKDAGNDGDKKNIAQVYGLEEAERMMRERLHSAIDACRQLPFDTRLLQGVVKYFATRRK